MYGPHTASFYMLICAGLIPAQSEVVYCPHTASFYMLAHVICTAIVAVGSVGIRKYYNIISILVTVVLKIQICIIDL